MNPSAKDDSLVKAKRIVFRLLKLRFYSEAEIQDKLKRKNFSQTNIDQTIQYFKKLELINDRQFAQKWIQSRLKKPFGTKRIQFELKTKGVDQNIIDSELNAAKQDPDALKATVIALARNKAGKYQNIDQNKIKQRVFGYLTRRGFSGDLIYQALKEL